MAAPIPSHCRNQLPANGKGITPLLLKHHRLVSCVAPQFCAERPSCHNGLCMPLPPQAVMPAYARAHAAMFDGRPAGPPAQHDCYLNRLCVPPLPQAVMPAYARAHAAMFDGRPAGPPAQHAHYVQDEARTLLAYTGAEYEVSERVRNTLHLCSRWAGADGAEVCASSGASDRVPSTSKQSMEWCATSTKSYIGINVKCIFPTCVGNLKSFVDSIYSYVFYHAATGVRAV